MTISIDDVTIFTYEEWKKLLEVKEMYKELQDCDECNGDGWHECSCGHTHECGECGGSGKQEGLRDIYEDLLRIEIKMLHNWIDGKPLKSLSGGKKPDGKYSIIRLNTAQ